MYYINPDDPNESDYGPETTDIIYSPERPSKPFTSNEEYLIPKEIRTLYNEIKNSIAYDSLLLAGGGLRMLIEAIAKNLELPTGNLQAQITQMKERHLIADAQCTMLHQIRFLGNDAVHDLTLPNIEQINSALSTIEILIRETYIQPSLAKQVLPPIISYDEFKQLIINNALGVPSGTVGTISFFLPQPPANARFENKEEFIRQFLNDVKDGAIPEFSYVPTTPTPKPQEKIKRN